MIPLQASLGSLNSRSATVAPAADGEPRVFDGMTAGRCVGDGNAGPDPGLVHSDRRSRDNRRKYGPIEKRQCKARAMSSATWLSNRQQWWSEAVAWIGQQAESLSLGAVVEVTSHKVRPWGATLRVRTSSGTVFFKSVPNDRRYEVALTCAIGDRWQALAPDVLAVDVDRSWLLLADHGVPIREAVPVERQVYLVADLLPTYAEMQSATYPLTGEWAAQGMPDRSVGLLPELFAAFLEGHDDPNQRDRCRAALPAFVDVCERLAATPSADAVDHADFHGTNVLFDGANARLIDWGDACITHPFTTLSVTFDFVLAPLARTARVAAVRRLRDAYLEPWGGATKANVEAFRLAMWSAPVIRILSLADAAVGDVEVKSLLVSWLERRPLLGREVAW
jgi:hypothetical protein